MTLQHPSFENHTELVALNASQRSFLRREVIETYGDMSTSEPDQQKISIRGAQIEGKRKLIGDLILSDGVLSGYLVAKDSSNDTLLGIRKEPVTNEPIWEQPRLGYGLANDSVADWLFRLDSKRFPPRSVE